jgi:hypothetical protein
VGGIKFLLVSNSGIAADCMKKALVVPRVLSFASPHMMGSNDPLMDVADS